jgi:hypothetical protein
LLQYLDRNAIALAKLSSIEAGACTRSRFGHDATLTFRCLCLADLGLSDTQYQTAVSILFVGYVICGEFKRL